MSYIVSSNKELLWSFFSTRIIPKPMSLEMKGPMVLMPSGNLNPQQTKLAKKGQALLNRKGEAAQSFMNKIGETLQQINPFKVILFSHLE